MTSERWLKVNELFYAAIESDAARRSALLEEACAGDEALRREVESLVASHERAAGFLREPAFEAGARLLANEEGADSFIGKRVGAFTVTREIGRGGMGAVYEAVRDEAEFEQRVAIKLIKRGMDTDAALRRFRDERRILAALEHPNIARLIDGGATEDGRQFLVMELVEGEPIDE